MEDDAHLFLTTEQARNAVCLDFRGYGPQPMLFCEVLRSIYGNGVIYKREPGSDGLWVSSGPSHRMQRLAGDDLVTFMCRIVVNADLAPDALATLCRKIFQTACRPARCPQTGRPGIEVQTQMENFTCKQCGRCCIGLDYHNGITAEDVHRLEQAGRTDVLQWIGRTRDSHGRTRYRMWVEPGTQHPVSGPCPFLKKDVTGDRRTCAIHDVKPHICRHYPVSRKHAVMTGCAGFG